MAQLKNRLFHRGHWKDNTISGILFALTISGAEFDIRDSGELGNIVIAHDPNPEPGAQTLKELLEQKDPRFGGLMAINVKSAGLGPWLELMLKDRNDYFLFDMSFPDLWDFKQRGLICAQRFSDLEPMNSLRLEDYPYLFIDYWNNEPPLDYAALDQINNKVKTVMVHPTLRGAPESLFARLRPHWWLQ